MEYFSSSVAVEYTGARDPTIFPRDVNGCFSFLVLSLYNTTYIYTRRDIHATGVHRKPTKPALLHSVGHVWRRTEASVREREIVQENECSLKWGEPRQGIVVGRRTVESNLRVYYCSSRSVCLPSGACHRVDPSLTVLLIIILLYFYSYQFDIYKSSVCVRVFVCARVSIRNRSKIDRRQSSSSVRFCFGFSKMC